MRRRVRGNHHLLKSAIHYLSDNDYLIFKPFEQSFISINSINRGLYVGQTAVWSAAGDYELRWLEAGLTENFDSK